MSPRARRPLYALLVTVVMLGSLEIAARYAEEAWFPWHRSIPVPAPTHDPSGTFQAEAQQARQKIESGAIPLADDPERGWKLTPSMAMQSAGWSMRTNKDGMRGGELAPKPAGTTRLFSLGDSSIFGDGVDEDHVFTAVAAAELGRAIQAPVDSVIGAVPGHTSSQSLTTLRSFGARVTPDWVVIGNLWSDLYAGNFDVSDHSYLPESETLRRSALYRLAWRALTPWLTARKVSFLASREDVGSLDGTGTPTRIPLPTYLANLRAMADEAKKLGARPAFVMLAAPMDLDVVPPPVTVSAFRDAMRTVAAENGAPLVDGPALFKSAGATVGYFDDQVHPNAYGHALLGHGLAVALEAAPQVAP